jgi:hypothetical protein
VSQVSPIDTSVTERCGGAWAYASATPGIGNRHPLCNPAFRARKMLALKLRTEPVSWGGGGGAAARLLVNGGLSEEGVDCSNKHSGVAATIGQQCPALLGLVGGLHSTPTQRCLGK